jgi:hypothetical protein
MTEKHRETEATEKKKKNSSKNIPVSPGGEKMPSQSKPESSSDKLVFLVAR